jgi:AraC-like DNA-binding protein
MHFEFGFYSSLLLIFFVHGLVYAVLLLRRGLQNNSLPDRWLALFLLLCILYIAPWMLGFGGWYDHQPYRDILFYCPFQQLFFVGPVIFFYTQSLLNPTFRFAKKEWLHFLPGLLYLLFCIVVFVTDKLWLHQYYFLARQEDPDFDLWYQLAGFASMVFYFLVSLRYYNLYRTIIVQVISYADVVMFRWVKKFLLAFLLMLVLRLLFFIAGMLPVFNKMAYAGAWWEYFSFSIIFYYIAITGYSNTIVAKLPFKLNLIDNKKILLLTDSKIADGNTVFEEAEIVEENEAGEGGDSSLLNEWMLKILQLVEQEKVYEDAELSLVQMSKQLKTNPTILSKVINQGFGKNFNDFINHYRIEAVKAKLQAGEQKAQTLVGIAYDCGFNSKATFNRAFKKATGTSPKEWMGKNIAEATGKI